MLRRQAVGCAGIRFSIVLEEKEVARAYLYIFGNDLHAEPVGYLEDVFVDENFRGRGFMRQLLEEIFQAARENKCYKIVATSRFSRPEVHAIYERFGFKKHGLEFRLDL